MQTRPRSMSICRTTFSETLLELAEALEEEGISDATREQWDTIVTLVNQAHLRFSEEEIDLDTY